VQKVDLQPVSGYNPNHVAVSETMIHINDQQFWLYAAMNPETTKIHYLRPFATTMITLTERFLARTTRETRHWQHCTSR
jgi:putative transposase